MPFVPRLAPQHHVYAGFAFHAVTMGSIFPRLPDIRDAMGIGEGALGLGLIGLPVGTLAALTFATPLLERMGFRRALRTIIPSVALLYAVAVHAQGPLALFLMLIPIGLLIGSAEIILNVEADRTEARVGRRIMNRAHSFWSMGFCASGLLGAGLAHLGVSPQLHLALVVPLAAVGVGVLLRDYDPSPPRPRADDMPTPRFAKPTWPILVLVALTLSALLLEGAGLDWSAIYMRNLFDSGPFLAGAAVAAVTLTQAVSRYFADAFVETHSPARVARVLLSFLGLGVVILLFPVSPWLAYLGFALIGLGTSAIFPLAMSAAAQRTDRPAAINVAALAQISFVAFLLGPPLLGMVAENFGVQWAYGLGLPLVVLSFAATRALDPAPAREKPANARERPI